MQTPKAAATLAIGAMYIKNRLGFLVVGVGVKQNAKCEMLLRKMDGEKNVQNCGFSAKLRNGDGGEMLHD